MAGRKKPKPTGRVPSKEYKGGRPKGREVAFLGFGAAEDARKKIKDRKKKLEDAIGT